MRAALFSGGDDSLAATLYAFTNGLADTALHIDTTIAAPATGEFVRETCEREGWPLAVYRAPETYRELVLRHGFPGPAVHQTMYYRLKERALREFKRDAGGPVTFITGVRASESSKRAKWVVEHERKKGFIWHNPLYDWSKADVLDYIGGRPRNPVSLTMHLSGDCLCGCFARPDERQEWATWWPEVDAMLTELEDAALAAGLSAWRWGVRPDNVARGQLSFAHFACESCRQ